MIVTFWGFSIVMMDCLIINATFQQTIFVFSVSDWNQLAMEANADSEIINKLMKFFAFENISPHQPPLQASSSPILRIRIWSIVDGYSTLDIVYHWKRKSLIIEIAQFYWKKSHLGEEIASYSTGKSSLVLLFSFFLF